MPLPFLLAYGCTAPGLPPADLAVTQAAVSTETSGVITCAEPELREERGPMFVPDWGPEWDAQPDYGDDDPGDPGWGAAVEDFDGDGVAEIVLANRFGTRLYQWDASTATYLDRTDRLPPVDAYDIRSSVAGDYDGDGHLDLYMGVYAGPDRLLRNRGDGTFEEVTDTVGLVDEIWTGTSATWGDVDGDDDLDLFVSNPSDMEDGPPEGEGQDNLYYVNGGDGTLTELSATLPPRAQIGYTMVSGLVDLDDDVDLDLYIVNDRGHEYTPNLYLRNDGGTFTEAPDGSGLDVGMGGMGLGIGDNNGDLLPDLLVSGWQEVKLLESGGDDTWYETGVALGIVSGEEAGSWVAWGNELADFDNDGDLDAFVTYGSVFETGLENPALQPDELWLQQDDGTFEQVADAWTLADDGMQRGVTIADLDDDGYLDILTRKLRGSSRAHMSRCGTLGWVRVTLRQPGANAYAVGARVLVEAGGRTQVRWITDGATGISGSSPLEAHFGLGAADVVDRIAVRWPDGRESTVSGLDARQRIRITREP